MGRENAKDYIAAQVAFGSLSRVSELTGLFLKFLFFLLALVFAASLPKRVTLAEGQRKRNGSHHRYKTFQ
jgi:hypothetical protein